MKKSIFYRHLYLCWIFLYISILFEVCGTSFLKYSQDKFPVFGVMVAIFTICLSYFTLSKAIARIPLGVAYAIWESAGLGLIVIISVLFLGEIMDNRKALGLLMVFSGSILIHQGTGAGKAAKCKTKRPAKKALKKDKPPRDTNSYGAKNKPPKTMLEEGGVQ